MTIARLAAVLALSMALSACGLFSLFRTADQVVVGDDGDVHYSSPILKSCPGAEFELSIVQQDADHHDKPPVKLTGFAAAGSIQFKTKDIDPSQLVQLTLTLVKGECEIVPDQITAWITLTPVPKKPHVYSVDLKKFSKR